MAKKTVLKIGRIEVEVWTMENERAQALSFYGVDSDEADFDFTLPARSVPKLLNFIKKTFPETYHTWQAKN